MAKKILFALILLLLSNTGFSLISKKDWVWECENSQGDKKHTFTVIRHELGKRIRATCNQAYDKIKNLKRLDLRDNQLSDLSPLAGLTNLEALFISHNQLSDLSPLAELTNLRILWVGGNQISDISCLAGLTNLTHLDLSHNQISNFSPISHLVSGYYKSPLVSGYQKDSQDLSKLEVFFGKYDLHKMLSKQDLKSIKSAILSGNYYDQLSCAASEAIKHQDPSFFQLLVDAGLDLEIEIGYAGWGKFYKEAACRDEVDCKKIRNIIEDTHYGALWNISSSKERLAITKEEARRYSDLKRYDNELKKVLESLDGGHTVFLNFERRLFGHEAEIFVGNKGGERLDGPIVKNALKKILSNKNMTTRFMGANTDKFHMNRNSSIEILEHYLSEYEDDLEVLILSGHGYEDEKGSDRYCFGNHSECIDFSIFTQKSLSKLKIIALSACYPNKVANELAKHLPSSVAILHTDSDEKTKCHDFENVVEYMMGSRIKNTQLSPHNCAIKCVLGNGCSCCIGSELKKQMKYKGELYSGSSRYSPVKITWGML